MTEMLKKQEQIMFLQQGCSFDQRPDIFIETAKTGCDRLHMYVFNPVVTPPFSIYPLLQCPLGLSAGTQTFCTNIAAAPQCG